MHPDIIYNIANKGAVVNPQLPHMSDLFNGLNPKQVEIMNEALLKGIQQTPEKAGSLGSIDKVYQEMHKIAKMQNLDKNDMLLLESKFDDSVKPYLQNREVLMHMLYNLYPQTAPYYLEQN